MDNNIRDYYFAKDSIVTHTDSFATIKEFSKPYDIKFLIVNIEMPNINGDEIVEVLDKFDALVNDISIGLPAEIKARRQQYEYYREKLLTFKEKTLIEK